jgi:hypothetical protein
MSKRLTIGAPNHESSQVVRNFAQALGLTLAAVQETVNHAFDVTAAVSGTDIAIEALNALNYVAKQQNATVTDADPAAPPPPPVQ